MAKSSANFGLELSKILNLPETTTEFNLSVKPNSLVEVEIKYFLLDRELEAFEELVSQYELVKKELSDEV